MKKEIIYWGATGQVIVLHDFLSDNFNAVAIFDHNTNIDSPIKNTPIYYGNSGFLKWINLNKENQMASFVVGIGGAKGFDRARLSEMLITHGLIPVTAVHPSSIISRSAVILEGNQILMGACISAKVHLGKYVIINTNASIDHECKIGTGCHIGPGATLAGNIAISDFTFIGSGSVILPNITIGKNVIVGAGSVVTKSIADNCIVYGNPASKKGETDFQTNRVN